MMIEIAGVVGSGAVRSNEAPVDEVLCVLNGVCDKGNLSRGK